MYKLDVKEQAFALFAQEKSIADIGRIMKISQHTLFRWKKDGNWAKRMGEVSKRVKEQSIGSVSDMKLRQIGLTMATQIDYAKTLKANPGKTTFSDADKAMSREGLLRGEATERSEQVIIEIVRMRKNGDRANKDKVGAKRQARRSTGNTGK